MTQISPLKIIFAGTPIFAAKHLQALLDSHHQVVATYTQPDKPAGRGKKLNASAVKQLAVENDIPVFQPFSLKSEDEQKQLQALGADIMVVVAYGLLLPKAVLDIPKLGCINVHGSILPRWRGAAPIQRAIEAGDTFSGITIMQMDVGLDTGDMLLKTQCPIFESDSTTDLHDRLCDIGPPALIDALDGLATHSITATKQDDSLSNYARKIEKHEAIIDWQESAEVICRKIRAFNPFPICYGLLNEERIRIHSAKPIHHSTPIAAGHILTEDQRIIVGCGNKGSHQDGSYDAILIERLQLAGKKPTSAHDFLNGAKNMLNKHVFSQPQLAGS